MPHIPTRIDRYEIKGRLGSGGMGTLYLARDTNPTTDRLVVLKLLRSTFDSDEPRRRFAREAQALAGLNHPNIVVIYDSGEYDDFPFIVMEYVRGETLAEIIKRRAPTPLGEKLRLLSELCAGLAHAHEAGIVHRDIKPANLVVDLNGRLKILDFGIARLDADATARDGQLTLVSARIGTPGYMSPEQLETGEVDARSDVFAVGAVAYELISGHEAFAGATTTQIERRVIGEQPVPLVSAVPGLDPAIAEIIASALEKEVGRRCQSAADLGEAFDRVRERLPETGHPPRPTPQPRPSSEKKSRRERAADAAYERAVTAYRDGAEECARRFAMEAIAELPEHAGARHLLLELGRFRDVEPWLPAAPMPAGPAAPAGPQAEDSAATLIAPLPPPPPARPPVRPSTAPPDSGTMVAPPVSPDSSETLIATPAVAFDDSETLIAPMSLPPRPQPPPVAPDALQPPVAPASPPSPVGFGAAGVPAQRPPAVGQAPARAASAARPSSSPALRWILIGVGLLALVVAGAAVAWFLWPSGQAGQTSTAEAPGVSTTPGAGAGQAGQPPAAPTQHLLTIDPPTGGTVEGPGIRCGSGGTDCAVNQPAGIDVTLAARPDPGFTFGGFVGECSSAGVVSMTAPRRCGATFSKAVPPRASQAERTPQPDRARRGAAAPVEQPRPPIVVAPAPAVPASPMILTVKRPTDGTIVGNGIECGPAMAHCTSPQPTGASVRLMAQPKPGFVFTGYTDDCDVGGLVVMTTARTCGATFAKADSRLPAASFPTLTITRPRTGTVVGPGIECGTGGSRCKAPQPVGSTVLLRVQPDSGFFFVRFIGDCDAGGLTVMSGPKQCAVTILSVNDGVPNEVAYPTLTISKPTGGTVVGNGIECGTLGSACSAPQPGARQVRLLARPDVGFVFVRFTGDCDGSGVTMMDAPRTCSATFAKGGQ
jgi:hypothetical protein